MNSVFNRPDVLSAADPWQVLRAGLVPYWLPGPGRYGVRELHRWLAGGEPYSQVEVLVEPPGAPRDDVTGSELATLADFAAAATFARFQGRVEERGARAYPDGQVSPWRAHRGNPAP